MTQTEPEPNTGARTSIALEHDPQQGVRLVATVPPSSLVTLKAAALWLWSRVLPLITAYLGYLAGRP